MSTETQQSPVPADRGYSWPATIAGNLLGWYILTVFAGAIPYFNYTYAQTHGFISWFFFGEIVATAKALVWPLAIYMRW